VQIDTQFVTVIYKNRGCPRVSDLWAASFLYNEKYALACGFKRLIAMSRKKSSPLLEQFVH